MAADLITSFAALLWPLLVLAALLLLWRPLAALLRRSDLELELGGQRITITQLNDQQNRMIADLQKQVASLRAQVEGFSAGGELTGPPVPDVGDGTGMPGGQPSHDRVPVPGHEPAERQASREVLWVDDHPENNAIMLDGLQRDGVVVTLARSTREAMERLRYGRFGAIVSDMGRTEDGTENPTAGLTLLRKVRELDPAIPFVVYTSPATVRSHGAVAFEAGVTEVTSSEMTVRAVLGAAGILRHEAAGFVL
ncbi:response regulator [Myceligenerans indicum]|uniref:Response regulator n=1 Tax=Myceligenerans indicum TaxID=2593663 RepID=A0ABS1LIR8_9MICO|nr:response regulator [Myceligenerans indicum]MBL0886135.1 response regulator [Myceligenerans indicum]